MRKDRVAEWILLLVAPDRAAPTVGDLMEDADARGALWFWTSILRTVVSFLWRSISVAPLRMVMGSALVWFAYMLVSLLFIWGLALVWGIGSFFTHHTGLELLTNLLRVRIDWTMPPGVMRWTEVIAVWILAPFQMGRLVSRWGPGRELASWAMLLVVWPFMATFVPFAAASLSVTLPMLPVILTNLLLGALWERSRRSFSSPS